MSKRKSAKKELTMGIANVLSDLLTPRKPEDTHPLVGKIVRVVQMDGCMAHSRSRSRTGTVLRVEKRPLYGSGGQYTMALVRFGTGEEWHPAGEFFQQNNGEIVRRI